MYIMTSGIGDLVKWLGTVCKTIKQGKLTVKLQNIINYKINM